MSGSGPIRIPTIAAAFAAAMVFGGCGQPERPAEEPVKRSGPPGYRRAWSDDDVVKPAWIANPTRDGTIIAAWGSVVHDPFAGHGVMRNRAMQQAREELARMVQVRIQSVLKDYFNESGGSGGAAFTTFNESVSRSIANQSLQASFQQDEWSHPKTGELYVLAVVDRTFAGKLAATVAQTAASSPEADAHARAKLGADAAHEELDKLIDKSFSASGR